MRRKKGGIAAGVFAAFAIIISIASALEDKDVNNTLKETPIADDQRVETNESKENANEASLTVGNLQVHFLDVGQGDATLITCDGESMLIDAGNNHKGTAVQAYLKSQDITELKYLVGTHPDADHIGGLDVIITKYDVTSGEVWMPDEENDTDTYRDVVDAIEYKNLNRVEPVPGSEYALGNAKVTVLAPKSSASESNDNSLIIMITNGSNRFLFTGDASEDEEESIINDDIAADVLKVGHHGSKYSTSQSFLDRVNPTYAVISVGDNSYGHPSADCLNKLRMKGVQVFRTDEQGCVVVKSDGENITWNCSPSESWQAGE